MFTSVEENYIKGLISSYYKHGFKYYICHTVTENNNNYDVYIYFSKEKIKAITPISFDISNGIFIKIDSSSRNDNTYNPSIDYRILISDSNYSDVISVNKAEFIYTNAIVDYEVTSLVVNPDITMNSSSNYSTFKLDYICCCILFTTFLYIFICNLLRIRK